MGSVDQVTIKVYEDMRRAGITPDLIKRVRQQKAAQRQIEFIGGPGVMRALQRYKEVIDRHTPPPYVGTSGPRAKVSVVLDTSNSSSDHEGVNASDGDDDDDGGGDSDSDGPRRRTPPIFAKRSASSRGPSRAVRRKLKSPHSAVVIMHKRALVTFVLICLLCLFGALGFAVLGHEKLALACIGLPALRSWGLASKLLKPK
jgi:hypothetical protein